MHNNPSNVAVPPPQFHTYERPRSNSQTIVRGRLRAASEMHTQGIVNSQEKARMKQLILQSDPQFRECFDKARTSGDFSSVKRMLKQQTSTAQMQDAMLNDMTDMNLGEVDDFSSFLDDFQDTSVQQHSQQQPYYIHQQHRQSVGFGTEFGHNHFLKQQQLQQQAAYTRKRQASRSMPVQGMHKVLASTQQGQGRPMVPAQARTDAQQNVQRYQYPVQPKKINDLYDLDRSSDYGIITIGTRGGEPTGPGQIEKERTRTQASPCSNTGL
mmetsp:Transcript_1973/g.3964  ORF Transcript_1973/g.3964 Transcript_1973/m.3964 type:complete len:269 (-) Transcript_1973:1097-1903(-)